MVAVIGLIVAAVVIALVYAWYATYQYRRAPAPPEARDHEEPGPPPERDRDWDPRERYEDG